MRYIVYDIETAVTRYEDGKIDNSPYHPGNYIVSFSYCFVENGKISPVDHIWLRHNELLSNYDVGLAKRRIQAALDSAHCGVAHNAKFDNSFLLESGFEIPDEQFDTLLAEYVFARGLKERSFSLKATAEHYGVSAKKSDLVDDLFKSGVGFEAIPMEIVQEYAIADVQATAEILLKQLDRLSGPDAGLIPTIKMTNEFCRVLTDMERNGLCIDMVELDRVEKAYQEEKATLEAELRDIVASVMGDTPINLSSPEQLSQVIYSRAVTDKSAWATVFNIGKNERGKPLRKPKMVYEEFKRKVNQLTEKLMVTKAIQCKECKGTGKVHKTKKDGSLYAKPNKCAACGGHGMIYEKMNKYAGFKVQPRSVEDTCEHGFATDKKTLQALAALNKDNEPLVSFLTKVIRLNAVDTYLSSFVGGIKGNVQDDGVLHGQFMQHVTATGRLSSRDPNLQNFPRDKTFPIRKVFKSRFEGGKILEIDYSGLEFRVAGELSGDTQIFDDVINGKDIHKQTASIIFQKDTSEVSKEERQNAKAHSFAPLYSATGKDQPPHVATYYNEFFNIYRGVKKWHTRLENEALTNKKIVTPSGREFSFQKIERKPWGVTHRSTLVNYPVQSFATADIVPCGIISVWNELRRRNAKSQLVLTVHDSLVLDIHPGEEYLAELVSGLLSDVGKELKRRYDYDLKMPLAVEAKWGPNWLDTEVVK